MVLKPLNVYFDSEEYLKLKTQRKAWQILQRLKATAGLLFGYIWFIFYVCPMNQMNVSELTPNSRQISVPPKVATSRQLHVLYVT